MGWIILTWGIIVIVLAVLGYYVYELLSYVGYKGEVEPWKKVVASALVLIVLATIGTGIFTTNKLMKTESFKRFQKSVESEFKGGITREITVHLENGDVIYQEEGKFDVNHSQERIKWVNEEGKVQIIYLGRSSTAVVKEK